MNINSDAMLSVSEANRNFSLVTKMVDKFGQAVILKIMRQSMSFWISHHSTIRKPLTMMC